MIIKKLHKIFFLFIVNLFNYFQIFKSFFRLKKELIALKLFGVFCKKRGSIYTQIKLKNLKTIKSLQDFGVNSCQVFHFLDGIVINSGSKFRCSRIAICMATNRLGCNTRAPKFFFPGLDTSNFGVFRLIFLSEVPRWDFFRLRS